MDTTEVEVVDRGPDYLDLKYIDTHTSYFDLKIQNPRDLHGAPDYVVRQAVDFVIANSNQPRHNQPAWLIPVLELLLQ